MKATVYIETTIVGHLTSRPPADERVRFQMRETRDWWTTERQQFDCYISQAVIEEISRGDPRAAAERVKAVEDLPRLQASAAAEELAELLVLRTAIPLKVRSDAVHVAIAATNGMAYLLTWNCKHLANATVRTKIEKACRDRGFEPPIICTPTELQEPMP